MASELGEVFRSRQARKTLLGAGRGCAQARAGSDFAVPGEGRRHGRRAPRRPPERRRSCCHGAHAGGETRRPGRSAFRDPLRDGGSRPAEVGLAVHEADHRPDPPNSVPMPRPSVTRSWAIPNTVFHRPAGLARSIRRVPSRRGSSASCISWRAASFCRTPVEVPSTSRRRLPPHMQATWDLFGFDVKQYDPIENAPED